MGHSSKKKKKKVKGRGVSRDHSVGSEDDQDVLANELTALAAIFQEDFKILSEPPQARFSIKLRPYSNAMGFVDLNISATLVVRCGPGYPHKCPKLQVISEEGLSKVDADKLLDLLLVQGNLNAGEGRVMIFNLVEAAQEFLSEIAPAEQTSGSVSALQSKMEGHLLASEASGQLNTSYYYEGSFVCSSIDLFRDLCGDDTSLGGHGVKVSNISGNAASLVDKLKSKNILLQSRTTSISENAMKNDNLIHDRKVMLTGQKKAGLSRTTSNLNVVPEETEDDSKSTSSKASDHLTVKDTMKKNSDSTTDEITPEGELHGDHSSDSESGYLTSSSYVSLRNDDESQSRRKDLLLVKLLHLACSSKGSLANAIPELSLELHSLGMLSDWGRDLVSATPTTFRSAFDQAFEQQRISSRFTEFWKSDGLESSSKHDSRYLSDFEEVRSLGRGGFGHVVLCKNKLDGRHYAVKKIRLKDKSPHVNQKILREVATLSRLQHQHVVRYYQAWVETGFFSNDRETARDSITADSSSYSSTYGISMNASNDNRLESTFLYIQMEYCPRTLREDFESYNTSLDKDYMWHLFRQITEGLAHIHSQGIIHRDLTPSNIFFDVRNDIKIGDFGLAKFLKLEHIDQDQSFPTETTGISLDGTGQVGTYFYTAPEVEQSWPQINEKVDMYSLGVILFELWHPFTTAMERYVILSDLKQKGLLPASWAQKCPNQSTLVRRLMSPSPSDRPSATELIHYLPPRLEDEWLNDILRTIQAPEDSYVYGRVVSTIFDEERLSAKYYHQQDSSIKVAGNELSFLQHAELDTEMHDIAIEVSKEVFKQHCAKRLEVLPLRMLDGGDALNRKAVKILTQGGNMLELCYELRTPFVNWVVQSQKSSIKRYEISWVYRREIGCSAPTRFLQGDFDIIGGAPVVTEAEVIKVVMDIASRFFHSNAVEIHLNHGQLLESVWSWVGVATELRQNVAELLSTITSSCPQSAHRKSKWKFVRRQLLQDLHLSEMVVDRLQTADLRLCGSADQALARLHGALSPDKATRKALEELSTLLSYLRVWGIEQNVSLDVLMPPTETYYRSLFFQIYLKENVHGADSDPTLLSIGGRYDSLVQQMSTHQYQKVIPPGAAGVSIALEKVLHSSVDFRSSRTESTVNVLVCSRGGGGLLHQRMEFVADLWQANIKADFFPQLDPTLKEQYDYAIEHDIKYLVILTEAGLSDSGFIKVRNLELKKEKELNKADVLKFLTDVMSPQFKNLAIWS